LVWSHQQNYLRLLKTAKYFYSSWDYCRVTLARGKAGTNINE